MIQLTVNSHVYTLHHNTQGLLKRMLSPICGIVREIGFVRRSSREPRIMATGADLTGMHVLLNMPDPGKGAYHIGADGIHFNEAIIKTLGESIERYAQLIAELANRLNCVFLSYSQMRVLHANSVIPIENLILFKEKQYKKTGFPFEPYADQPLTWVKLPSLLGYHYRWVPAQLLLVGYQIKKLKSEPWLSAAVTTGTAAHTDKYKALINAILELIQIDSAMGHWYTTQAAHRIIFDKRTLTLEKALLKQGNFSHTNFSFYLLNNPDLLGFSIACVYRNHEKSFPKVAIGLGSDVGLIRAMYKAYLETIGIIGFTKVVVFKNRNIPVKDTNEFYNLDSNVGYYASGHEFSLIQEKFPLDKAINATCVAKDIDGSDIHKIQVLINRFKDSGKELLFADLTCPEVSDLGFYVPRVWSPDTLSLCLPSAPWFNHTRFKAYGGVAHDAPHPYP